MMENVYLQEAFKALDILNEEDFNLTSTDGFEDAKDFIDKDEKVKKKMKKLFIKK